MAKIAISIPDRLNAAIEGINVGKGRAFETLLGAVFDEKADPATYGLRYVRLVAAIMAGDLEPVMTGGSRLVQPIAPAAAPSPGSRGSGVPGRPASQWSDANPSPEAVAAGRSQSEQEEHDRCVALDQAQAPKKPGPKPKPPPEPPAPREPMKPELVAALKAAAQRARDQEAAELAARDARLRREKWKKEGFDDETADEKERDYQTQAELDKQFRAQREAAGFTSTTERLEQLAKLAPGGRQPNGLELMVGVADMSDDNAEALLTMSEWWWKVREQRTDSQRFIQRFVCNSLIPERAQLIPPKPKPWLKQSSFMTREPTLEAVSQNGNKYSSHCFHVNNYGGNKRFGWVRRFHDLVFDELVYSVHDLLVGCGTDGTFGYIFETLDVIEEWREVWRAAHKAGEDLNHDNDYVNGRTQTFVVDEGILWANAQGVRDLAEFVGVRCDKDGGMELMEWIESEDLRHPEEDAQREFDAIQAARGIKPEKSGETKNAE